MGIVALLLGQLVAAGVRAEIPRRKAKRVAVFPFKRLDLRCGELFQPAQDDQADLRPLEKALEETLLSQHDVKVVFAGLLRKRVSGTEAYREKLVLGRERFLLGKEFYHDLRQAEAEDHLSRAVKLLDPVYYDAVEPQTYSEILLLLGVTLMEEGKPAAALQAFKRALFLAPATRFISGYYPKPVEDSLVVACEDLRQSLKKEMPLGSLERTLKFMKKYRLDTLFFPLVEMEDGKRELVLVAFERKTRTLASRTRIPLAGDDRDRELLQRAVTRWLACTPYAYVPKRVEERNRFVIGAAYQQLAYLKYPTRYPLLSMGFSFDASHFFRRTFAVVAKAQFLYTLGDRYGDLLDEFTSVRLILGPAFSVSGSWWRFYLMPAAELHYMGAFEVTRDPNCKFFAKGKDGWSRCDPDRVDHFDRNLLAGVNVHVGSQFYFPNDLFLGLGVSITTYFAPFERFDEMNFPVSAEVGGGIAF